MPVLFIALTDAVAPLWPADTVLLVAVRDIATDLRWVCPDLSTGSATVKDQGFVQQLLAVSEQWTGNFPALLSKALSQTTGCKKCKEAKDGEKRSVPGPPGLL